MSRFRPAAGRSLAAVAGAAALLAAPLLAVTPVTPQKTAGKVKEAARDALKS